MKSETVNGDADTPQAPEADATPTDRGRGRGRDWSWRDLRLGDVFVVLAGGSPRELAQWGVDRLYYMGLGTGLLISATVATVGLTFATIIVWNPPWAVVAALAVGYFLMIFALDRWLVSDPTAGFRVVADEFWLQTLGRWITHFFTEVLKILPRIAIVVVGSLLIAEFLLLAIYSKEIQEQIKQNQAIVESNFQQKVESLALKLAAPYEALIVRVDEETDAQQAAYELGLTARATEDAAVAALIAQTFPAGNPCRSEVVRYDTLPDGTSRPIYAMRCPAAWTQLHARFDEIAARYPDTQASVDARKQAIRLEAGYVEAQDYVKSGARAEAAATLSSQKPEQSDGLLARQRALDQLTNSATAVLICAAPDYAAPTPQPSPSAANPTETPTPDDSPSPTPVPTPTPTATVGPSAAADDPGEDADPTCISSYNAKVAEQRELVRLWLLFFEILPVLIKFVRSLLPRTGYAAHMASIDDDAKARSQIAELWNKNRVDVARQQAAADLDVAVSVGATERELYRRGVGRARQRHRLEQVDTRLDDAAARAGRVRDGLGIPEGPEIPSDPGDFAASPPASPSPRREGSGGSATDDLLR